MTWNTIPLQSDIDDAITTHEGAANPHSQYGRLASANNWTATNTFAGDQEVQGDVTASISIVTIDAGGGIANTRLAHAVAANAGTADDLQDIDNAADGQLILITADTGDTITCNELGNLDLGGASRTLTDSDFMLLMYEAGSTKWILIAGSNILGGGSSHALLSGTHTDTATASATRGDLIVANADPAWNVMNLGSAGKFVASDGADVQWWSVDDLTSETTPDFDDFVMLYDGSAAANRKMRAELLPTLGKNLMWIFDSQTASADPGGTFFRLNNATMGSATAIYLDDNCKSSLDMSALVNTWASGDYLYLVECEDSNKALLCSITSVTDNTGWFTIAISVSTASGSAFTNGRPVSFVHIRGSGDDYLTDLPNSVIVEGMPATSVVSGLSSPDTLKLLPPACFRWEHHFNTSLDNTVLSANCVFLDQTGAGGTNSLVIGEQGAHTLATNNGPDAGVGYVLGGDSLTTSAWDLSKDGWFECWIAHPSSKPTSTWFVTFGLLDTSFAESQVNQPTNGIWLEWYYNVNSSQITGNTYSSGTGTQTNGSTAASSSFTRIAFAMEPGTPRVRFYVNGSQFGSITSNIPTSGQLMLGVWCYTGTVDQTNDMQVDYALGHQESTQVS